MENNPVLFDKYWRYRSKSAPHIPDCDEDCRNNTICAIRAGKSELRCDYEPDVLFGGKRYAREEHVCGINLVSVNSRNN